MLLVFDIGNTQTGVGVFDSGKLVADWRLETDRQKTADQYGIELKSLFRECALHGSVEAAVISCVVPPMTGIFEKMALRYFAVESLVVGPGVKTGLSIKIENPREVGADLVAGAVAAIHFYGAPLIIIDFGTATTFCAISPQGDYLGVAIAPGLGISGEALFQRAALLPRVEILKPKNVIGKNTTHSMQSGLYFGYLGLVEGMIARMKAELGCNPTVVATGGFAELIAAELKGIHKLNPNLTLEGLRLIYELNHGK